MGGYRWTGVGKYSSNFKINTINLNVSIYLNVVIACKKTCT
jgi:hypothetical protein